MSNIDWDKIPKGFDWVATDENGEVWAFTDRPEAELYAWYCKDGRDEIRVCLTGDREEGNWRDSLQHRPPKEPQPVSDWKAKYADLYLMYMEKIDECTMLREWRDGQHQQESEPDYRVKYEQLYKEVADFIDYRESYIELRERYLEQADKVRRLAHELEQTQAELNDVYKDREKLGKIVNLLNEA